MTALDTPHRPVEQRSLLRTAASIVPVTIVVQVTSFASSIALAHVLGATRSTDAYYLALAVPGVVSTMFLGALRSGAIPALTDVANDSSDALARAAGDLLRGVAIGSTIVTVGVVGVMEAILPLVAHGRLLADARPIVLELAPYAVFWALAGVFGALLAVRGTFALPVLVLGLESLIKLVLLLAAGHTLGTQALVIGNLAGSFLAVCVLAAIARRRGISIRISGGAAFSPFVRTTFVLTLPLIAGLSVLRLNPLVDRAMASGVGPGSVTALELGLRLFVVPLSLFVTVLVTPITATWAARFAADGWESLRDSAARAVAVVMTVTPLVVAVGVVLRRHLVAAIYGGGAYSPKAVHETASVLGMILLGMPAQMLISAMSAIFIVRKDTRFPLKIALLNVMLNGVLNLAFRPVFGVAGIALSTSITLTLLAVLYAAEVRRRWGGIPVSVPAVARAVGAAAVAAAVARGLLDLFPASGGRVTTLAAVLAVGAGATAAYVGALYAARDPFVRRLVGRGGGEPTRRRYDVLFYVPSIASAIAGDAAVPRGGAETQIRLLAAALARRGARVAVAAEASGEPLPRTVDGVDVIPKPSARKTLRLVGRLLEARTTLVTLRRAPSETVVTCMAGGDVAAVALFARLLGRRFVFASVSDMDFDLSSPRLRRRDHALYRFALRFAHEIVAQTEHQRVLCRSALAAEAKVAPYISELTPATGPPEALTWIGRADAVKQPLAFVALARALDPIPCRMVLMPRDASDPLVDEVRRAAADVPNLELYGALPRTQVLELIGRAAALVSTSVVEGFPNVFLEAWACGVPTLALSHDPDGVIRRHSLGDVAGGSFEALVVAARDLWNQRHDRAALSARCRAYVERNHTEETVGRIWAQVLRIDPETELLVPTAEATAT